MSVSCDNYISFVTDADSMLNLLQTMIENLEKTDWGVWSDEEKSGDIKCLAKLIWGVVNRQPAYLDALNPSHDSGEYGESASFSVIEYAPGIWILNMWFASKNVPIDDFGEIGEPFDSNKFCYFEHYWKTEFDRAGNRLYYCFYDGNNEEPILLPDEYKVYGDDALAALYCHEVAGIEPPCNENYFRYLANSNNGEAILEATKRDNRVTEFANNIDLRSLFKKRYFDAFASILEVSTKPYSPRKVDEYINAFLDTGNKKALCAFIRRYNWNEKMADLAISLCEARVNSELATIAIKEISDALKKKLPTTKPSLKKRGSIGTNSKQQSEVMNTELKLSAPVSISARKYFHNEKLKTISFEKGKKVADVVSLGKSSFEGCPHLEKLIMNDPKRCAVKFGERAMAECPSIVEIDLSNVSVIGKEAFSDCSGLVSVAFSEKKSSVTVYDKAFSGCQKLKEATFGHVQFKGSPFYDCGSLELLRFIGELDAKHECFMGVARGCKVSFEHGASTGYVAYRVINDLEEFGVDISNREQLLDHAVLSMLCWSHDSFLSPDHQGLASFLAEYTYFITPIFAQVCGYFDIEKIKKSEMENCVMRLSDAGFDGITSFSFMSGWSNQGIGWKPDAFPGGNYIEEAYRKLEQK